MKLFRRIIKIFKKLLNNKFLSILLLILLPLMVWATITVRNEVRKRAASTPPVGPNPIAWSTPEVKLSAESFYIYTNNNYFWGNAVPGSLRVTSNPANATYTTLEATWFEFTSYNVPVEMRIFIYFKSDGTYWWADEIRTYNGRTPGDWAFFHGTYFKSRLGQAFLGNLDLRSDINSSYNSRLHIGNFKLLAFANYPYPTPITNCQYARDGTKCGVQVCSDCPNNGSPCNPICTWQTGTCQNSQCVINPTVTISPNQCTGQPQCSNCTATECYECPMGGSETGCIPGCTKVPGKCYNGVCSTNPNICGITPTPTCIPRPACMDENPPCYPSLPVYGWFCPRITSTLTPIPTTPSGSEVRFEFLIKFAGVTGSNAAGAKADIHFVNGAFHQVAEDIAFVHSSGDIYKAVITFDSTQLPPGAGYLIYIKGEKHLQAKFCQLTGQTGFCGFGQYITIPPASGNTVFFNFTGRLLKPGDLYVQDGDADLDDFNKIKNLLTKPSSQLTDIDKLTADLNYDGLVNLNDISLMWQTLGTQSDEN